MHKRPVHGVEIVKPGDLVGMRTDLKRICAEFPSLAKHIDLWSEDGKTRIGQLSIDGFVVVLKTNDGPWVHVLTLSGKHACVLRMMISKLY